MGSPPYWAIVLEAANHNPLRAQLIMDNEGPPLRAVWWERWLIDRKYRAEAQNKDK